MFSVGEMLRTRAHRDTSLFRFRINKRGCRTHSAPASNRTGEHLRVVKQGGCPGNVVLQRKLYQ